MKTKIIRKPKTNILECKDSELSDFVFNTEKFYINIKDIKKLDQLLKNQFIYTSIQHKILMNDISLYLKEIN